ncbi:transposable element Tc1 transposase [Trichonephila clavipes]|uniref:Transposable element Tc1 transposase n=1 Tax=Trichonephila clavipes TaxID=2585209 RepID=A0A8X6RIP4_TRICX|nr:transposable element Tc1 transposase [Trichonephila clavipes]
MANNQSVRRHLDAFTQGRIIRKLEEGRSVTRAAIRGFSSGRPRGTTPADDRYIVLQARRNRRQTAGEITRHTTQATGRPISRFTVARRLHGGGVFARRPVRCVPLTPAYRRRRSLWCWEHRNWRVNEWGRVLFTDGSMRSMMVRCAMGLQFLFMDDNAPCHRTVVAYILHMSLRIGDLTALNELIWKDRKIPNT